MNKETVIFDFDGVIVDSFDYCLKINQTIVGDITADEYRKMFCGNFYEAHRKRIPDSESAENKRRYWEYFLKGIDQIRLVPGMSKILEVISHKYRVVIISSATSDVIKTILKRFDLLKFITDIFGADLSESKFEKFQMVMNKYGIKSSDCVFITDTLGDLIEANKANIQSFAVGWGFHDEATLERGNPIKIIETPQNILDAIEKNHQ